MKIFSMVFVNRKTTTQRIYFFRNFFLGTQSSGADKLLPMKQLLAWRPRQNLGLWWRPKRTARHHGVLDRKESCSY